MHRGGAFSGKQGVDHGDQAGAAGDQCRGVVQADAANGGQGQGEALHCAVQTALDYTWRTLRDAEQLGHGQYVPRRLPLDLA